MKYHHSQLQTNHLTFTKFQTALACYRRHGTGFIPLTDSDDQLRACRTNVCVTTNEKSLTQLYLNTILKKAKKIPQTSPTTPNQVSSQKGATPQPKEAHHVLSISLLHQASTSLKVPNQHALPRKSNTHCMKHA